MGTTTIADIIIDEASWIDGTNVGANRNGSVLTVRGDASSGLADQHALLKIPIPTSKSLNIPDDAIIDSLTIDLGVITTGSNRELQLYTHSNEFRWFENEVTFNSPYGGTKAIWTPAWAASTSFLKTFCSETPTGTSAAYKTWEVPNEVIQSDNITFDSTYYFALVEDSINTSSGFEFEDDSNAGSTGRVPRYSIIWSQPEPATPSISSIPNGTGVIIENKTTFDRNYSEFTLNWSTSASIAASTTHQAILSDTAWNTFNSSGLAQIGGNDVLATEDTAYYIRAFAENTSFVNAGASGSNTLKIVRPKLASVAISTAFTNTGDEGALTLTAANSVHAGSFKKVYVIWDGAASGETYTSNNIAVLTLNDTATSTIIKHIYGNSGPKKIWVGIEDENGFKSDLKLITTVTGSLSDPDPTARSATAVGSAAKKTMSITEYGLLDDTNVVNSIRSVTGDSGEQLYHHKWQHGLAYSSALLTSFATDIDNTELESGSKKLAVKASNPASSGIRLTIFGLASFYDNNGTETKVADTAVEFGASTGYYKYVSEVIAPEVFFNNDWSGDSPTGTANFFKHVDMCVITTSRGSGEADGTTSTTRLMVGIKDHIEGTNRLIAPYLCYTVNSYAWGGYKLFDTIGNKMVLDKSNNDIEWTASGDAYLRRDGLLEVGDKIYVTFSADTAYDGYYTIKALTDGAGDLGNKITFEEELSGSGTTSQQRIKITRDTRDCAAVPFIMYSDGVPPTSSVTVLAGVSQDRLGETTVTDTMKINYQKPKSVDLDELIANGHLAIESSTVGRTGGLDGRVPIGKQIYPVGVVRTNSGMPTLNVTFRTLTQTGLLTLWNLLEANRYDYVYLNSKRIDSPTIAHRNLIIKPINGNLKKDAAGGKYYLAQMSFMIIGEKRAIA